MHGQRLYKCACTFIRQPILPGSIPYNARDVAIMHMTDIWEQVMLNLKIKSTNVPREPTAVIAEIGSGQQLVNGPVVLQRIIFVWQRKFGSFNDVSRLKNNSQDKTCDVMHDENANQDLPPG